jgi:circadian clock protein KaiB
MNEPQPIDRVEEFEAFLRNGIADDQHYVLRLYVTGSTPRSTRAIQNLRALCEEHLQGRYDLQVIDIYQQPGNARREQIIAAPTLVKQLPAPIRKLVGDMSNTDQVLMGLDLRPKQ